MIKPIFTFSFLSLVYITTIAQNRSIEFDHSAFKELKEKALKENKLIFIDAYTTWCGPCKYMSKNIFTNDTVADFYNKHFINAKIDMEKGEGIELAKQYEVRCYPNLLFIDGNGILVHRVAGSMKVSGFMALAEEALNPEKCYLHYVRNYDNNKSNAEFLREYIYAKEGTCLDPTNLVNQYFSSQKEEDLFTEVNWNMIHDFVNSTESRMFNFLITNKEKYTKLYSKKVVEAKIADVYKSSLQEIAATKPYNEVKYNEFKAKVLALNTPAIERFLFELELNRVAQDAKWDDYTKLAIANVDKYYVNDADALNNISWSFYENINDKQSLTKAESWAKKACKLETNYANLDTYASVLYKLEKKELAKETASRAIETAKKEMLKSEDYKGTEDLLKKISELK